MSIASPDPALLHDVLDGCARRVGVLGGATDGRDRRRTGRAGMGRDDAWSADDDLDPQPGGLGRQGADRRIVLHGHGGGWAGGVSFELPESDAELVPVGGRRFLPAHETNDERRLQEFWFADGRRPEHCYDGFVAARRVDASG